MYLDVKLRSTEEYLYSFSPGSFSCRTYIVARVPRGDLERSIGEGLSKNDGIGNLAVGKRNRISGGLGVEKVYSLMLQSKWKLFVVATHAFLGPKFWLVMRYDVSRDLASDVSCFIFNPTILKVPSQHDDDFPLSE